MNRKVINALLSLFYQRIAEQFPRQRFNASPRFFEGLVDWDGPDGNGAVADDPLACCMDIFSGGKIHDGVSTPLCRPTHFLNFFVDRRGNGRVADIGINLHQKIPTDNHRLTFRMVDVDWNDRAASGYLGTHIFSRNESRSHRSP